MRRRDRRVWALFSVAGLLALVATPAAHAAVAQGVLDSSFGSGGSAVVPVGYWAGAASVAVQSDGRILTAGEANVAGQNVIVATRMTSAGRLDRSFGRNGIVTVAINGGAGVDSGDALVLQPDGKIVIAGSGRDGTYGPLTFAAVRLNTNGGLDQSFGQGGIANVPIGSYSIANAVALQPDGKIVLGGTALEAHNEFAAARLNPDGTLDKRFGADGISTFPSRTGGAWALDIQSDGKPVLAGQADYANPQVRGAQQFMAARLTRDGTPDPTFGNGGIVTIPVGATALGFGLAHTSDGKLLLAGPAFTTTNVNAVVKLTPSGAFDQSYGNGGIAAVQDWYGANGLVLDQSGSAVIPEVGPAALRVKPDGSADQSFGSQGNALATTGGGGAANGAAIQSEGKIVLAGATNWGGQTVILVQRIR
ncbi:MAG: delta-60 repeat domain-containing protein [Solirubrobacteraceae bacterium]